MAVFFIVLPMIIMSATGYRFNNKKNIIQKTGIIFLESKPEKVDVWLNGKLVDDKTPARMINLLPNQYELKLSKEGYYDWQKTVEVYQSQTTNLQYVRLFKKDLAAKSVVEGDIIELIKLADQDKLLLLKKVKEQYVVAIFDRNEEEVIYQSGMEITKVEWADNGSRVIVYVKNNIYLIDTNNSDNLVNLRNELGLVDFSSLKFDQYNSNNVFYIKNNKLVKVNLSNLDQITFPYSPLDYYVQGNTIYFLSSNSLNNIFLKKFSVSSASNSQSLLVLELADDYRIVDADGGFVTVKIDDKLIIWNEARGESEIIKGVDFFEWNESHDELLFGNEWELWSYRPNEEENYVLFTRTGEEIKDASWYQPNTHIFFIVDNRLRVVENLVSNRVMHDLAEFDQIDDFVVNKKGGLVYIVGRAGDSQGLFELEILDD